MYRPQLIKLYTWRIAKMALFHFHVTQVKRSAGQSVVTQAAYRAGEKLYSNYYDEVSDYTRKGGVVCSDILLPPRAPPEYKDRETLWNAVVEAVAPAIKIPARGANIKAGIFMVSRSLITSY